jgi:hypothetical protein
LDSDDPGGGGEFEPTHAPASAPAVAPARGWWIAPVAIIAVIAVIGIIGAAIDDTPTPTAVVATTAPPTVTSSTSTSTSTTIAPLIGVTTVASTATTASSVTSTSRAPTATTAAVAANRPMAVKVTYSNGEPQVGEEIVFDVTASDPDAGPIGECGGTPSFGDGSPAPSCQVACSAASTREATQASFRYTHSYSAPGTYTVRLAYQSAGGCTSQNSHASQRTLTFDVTVS